MSSFPSKKCKKTHKNSFCWRLFLNKYMYIHSQVYSYSQSWSKDLRPKEDGQFFKYTYIYSQYDSTLFLVFEGLAVIHPRGPKIQAMPGLRPLYSLVKQQSKCLVNQGYSPKRVNLIPFWYWFFNLAGGAALWVAERCYVNILALV